jgi:hypothetical protein
MGSLEMENMIQAVSAWVMLAAAGAGGREQKFRGGTNASAFEGSTGFVWNARLKPQKFRPRRR